MNRSERFGRPLAAGLTIEAHSLLDLMLQEIDTVAPIRRLLVDSDRAMEPPPLGNLTESGAPFRILFCTSMVMQVPNVGR